MHNTLLFICFLLSSFLEPIQALEGGRLEIVEEQKILHLKGSPYEIGYQQGSLLKDEIKKNIERFITPLRDPTRKQPPVTTLFLDALPRVLPHIPKALIEEMQGIADGSLIPFQDILLMNLFPEMFHCTGITVNGEATKDRELYHVRVLDYAAGNGLQHTAVLTVVEPDCGQPFLNVTYAGFVGCVTGMNLSKIAIGEIGGKGYGYWDGIPMAFLLRMILQHATTLEEVKQQLESAPRTCEYYYVFSDGKTGDAFAAYTTPDVLKYIAPGGTYETSILHNTFESVPTGPVLSVIHEPPKDMLIIVRDNHYDLLKDRLMALYGSIKLEDLQAVIKQPIAHQANLHNAIFTPSTLDVWISHAGKHNEPACNQPYYHFNLSTLLGK